MLPSGTVAIRNGTTIEMSEGYWWDPHYNLDTAPLIPAPAWLGHRTKKAASTASSRRHDGGRFDPLRVLDEACANIRNAGPGDKYRTIRREPFIVGCLVRDRFLDEHIAWHALTGAIAGLERHAADVGHMWKAAEGAFAEGLAAPSARRAGR